MRQPEDVAEENSENRFLRARLRIGTNVDSSMQTADHREAR